MKREGLKIAVPCLVELEREQTAKNRPRFVDATSLFSGPENNTRYGGVCRVSRVAATPLDNGHHRIQAT